MNFWYYSYEEPEKLQLSKKIDGTNTIHYFYRIVSFFSLLFIINTLILLPCNRMFAQEKTDQILFAIFELHCSNNQNKFKKIHYQSFHVLDSNEKLERNNSISFLEAKNEAIKQNCSFQFDKNGLPTKITVCDDKGNYWTQEPHFNNDSCKNIYWLKNEKLYAIFKVCHTPCGDYFLTDQMKTRLTKTPRYEPKFMNDEFLHYHNVPVYANNIDRTNEIPDYAFYHAKSKKAKPLKNVEYQYNTQGDWVKLVWFDRKQKPKIVTERIIAYYE